MSPYQLLHLSPTSLIAHSTNNQPPVIHQSESTLMTPIAPPTLAKNLTNKYVHAPQPFLNFSSFLFFPHHQYGLNTTSSNVIFNTKRRLRYGGLLRVIVFIFSSMDFLPFPASSIEPFECTLPNTAADSSSSRFATVGCYSHFFFV